MLKLCKHMDNELLYCGIENWTPCFLFFPLYVHFSVFYGLICVTVFSGTVQARIFKCGTYICRMSDCIEGFRLRVWPIYFSILSIFLSFPILHVNKIFMLEFSQELLKLEC